MRGQTGRVFRAPKRDRHGDAVDDNGKPVDMVDAEGLAYVGVIKKIIMGGLSASPKMQRIEATDTGGQIGCPAKASVQLQIGDRIEINDVRYRVTSPPRWGYESFFSGTKFGYQWFDVEGWVS